MVKSRLGWFSHRWRKKKDRRSRVDPEPLPISAGDLDPVLGTILWPRFVEMLDSEVSAGRGGALLVLDLDSQGRSAAVLVDRNRQEILPLLAQSIRQAVRSGDPIAHLDACRFVVLLRGAPQEVGDSIARRILESVDDTVFLIGEGLVRLSVGVGGIVFGSGTGDRQELLERAADNLEGAMDLEVRTLVR